VFVAASAIFWKASRYAEMAFRVALVKNKRILINV
jgi:hypothetical protein